MKSIWRMIAGRPVLAVFLFSVLISLAAGFVSGIKKPLISDASYFLHLAENVAAGKGYVADSNFSFWPGPTMQRLPLWPFTIAAALKILPWFDPNAVARVLCLLIHAGGAAAIAWLTLLVGKAESRKLKAEKGGGRQYWKINHKERKEHKVGLCSGGGAYNVGDYTSKTQSLKGVCSGDNLQGDKGGNFGGEVRQINDDCCASDMNLTNECSYREINHKERKEHKEGLCSGGGAYNVGDYTSKTQSLKGVCSGDNLQGDKGGQQKTENRKSKAEMETIDFGSPTSDLRPLSPVLRSRVFGLRSEVCSLIAGVIYTLHPGLLFLALQGLSEPLFILLVAAGMGLLIKAESRKPKAENRESRVEIRSKTADDRPPFSGLRLPSFISGFKFQVSAFLLGLACLVRANFVLFPVFLIALWIVAKVLKNFNHKDHKEHKDRGRQAADYRPQATGSVATEIKPQRLKDSKNDDVNLSSSRKPLRFLSIFQLSAFSFQLLLAFLLFYAPTACWVARNYAVCGHAGISTLRGQTFYGGNNPVVANELEWWGYWVFPDVVPGETPMRELAKTMSEVETDRYYTDKGMAWLKGHWREFPRLALGKLIRAFMPVPWKPSIGSWVVSGYRWGVYGVGVLVLLKRVFTSKTQRLKELQLSAFSNLPCIALAKKGPNFSFYQSLYGLCLFAMFAVSAVSVVMFWGNARFAFAFEPFLLILLGLWGNSPQRTQRF